MLILLCSCGPEAGGLLYLLGGQGSRKVKAQFQLTPNPILILIDDASERVDWPPAKRFLQDELAQELLRSKSAQKIIPPETIDRLRKADAEFERRSSREIGERAGAEQVLWIQVQDFLAEEEITDVDNAAFFLVTVKVINALETTDRMRVRVWPTSPEGHAVAASLDGVTVVRLKSKDAISKELADILARDIARLFHEWRAEGPERKP